MFKHAALAAVAATALFAVPASAATVVYTSGTAITLSPAGPNEVAGFLGFDVTGTGDFTATFTFTNPYNPAGANGSATFNFDGDVITFTGGDISGGGVFTTTMGALGSNIQIDRSGLASGAQTITFRGSLTPNGNGFARIGGQLSLTAVPEPGTWAMMILGFGVLGYGMRRRNAQVASTRAALRFA
ncbi:FxDxF family PEP-CTERM protein [Qipengyuania sediminis]|uniref:FxDxF family PEP-CTERM protein n=1 Tax=Qipengyuania sediminis TaxID=1532023 RepID=UPI00105A000B|nr:FxDxF family PEP-CTERM protein [Qipengyuania sediminis]